MIDKSIGAFKGIITCVSNEQIPGDIDIEYYVREGVALKIGRDRKNDVIYILKMITRDR